MVGQLQVPLHGTLVFFDVESLPDRNFYYLIGVRVEAGEHSTTYSFWANSSSDEQKIWNEFVAVLSAVENPILIHYGSFETKFLKTMCARYGSPAEGSTAAEAIASSLNLLSLIFARVLHLVMLLIAYRVHRNSGIFGTYGHEQLNHSCGIYRVS